MLYIKKKKRCTSTNNGPEIVHTEASQLEDTDRLPLQNVGL